MQDTLDQTRKLSQAFAYTSIQMHEAIGRKAGLSGTDHKYLGFLLTRGKMTAGELAKLSGLTTGAVTGMIDRFEKKKLVKRTFVEDDRRKVYIQPNSEKIMALMAPLYKDFRSKTEKILGSFSSKELKVLQTWFTKAIEVMNETTGKLNRK